MLSRLTLKRGSKPEGESPFWISFSDLMSALMTLFLVVMAVTLVAVTKDVLPEVEANNEREKDISKLIAKIQIESAQVQVGVDAVTHRVDLQKRVLFDVNKFDIDKSTARFLREYAPILLRAQVTPEGKRWIRNIVVEGFTDSDGTYLNNLRLSLDRSRAVVCVLLAPPDLDETPLTAGQKRQIQELFMVGGYSFNTSTVLDKAASRKIEMRIDFYGVKDPIPKPNDLLKLKDFGTC